MMYNTTYTPQSDKMINGGTQQVFMFENGYGASVVQHSFSYGGDDGKYEIAVLVVCNRESGDFTLCYDTPITNDVLGHVLEEDVHGHLQAIAELPERKDLIIHNNRAVKEVDEDCNITYLDMLPSRLCPYAEGLSVLDDCEPGYNSEYCPKRKYHMRRDEE